MHLPKPSEVLMFIGGLADSLDQLLALFLLAAAGWGLLAFMRASAGTTVTDLSSLGESSSQEEVEEEEEEAQQRERRRQLLQDDSADRTQRHREDDERRAYEQRLIDEFRGS